MFIYNYFWGSGTPRRSADPLASSSRQRPRRLAPGISPCPRRKSLLVIIRVNRGDKGKKNLKKFKSNRKAAGAVRRRRGPSGHRRLSGHRGRSSAALCAASAAARGRGSAKGGFFVPAVPGEPPPSVCPVGPARSLSPRSWGAEAAGRRGFGVILLVFVKNRWLVSHPPAGPVAGHSGARLPGCPVVRLSGCPARPFRSPGSGEPGEGNEERGTGIGNHPRSSLRAPQHRGCGPGPPALSGARPCALPARPFSFA